MCNRKTCVTVNSLISSARVAAFIFLRADVIPEDPLISSVQIRETMARRNTSQIMSRVSVLHSLPEQKQKNFQSEAHGKAYERTRETRASPIIGTNWSIYSVCSLYTNSNSASVERMLCWEISDTCGRCLNSVSASSASTTGECLFRRGSKENCARCARDWLSLSFRIVSMEIMSMEWRSLFLKWVAQTTF